MSNQPIPNHPDPASTPKGAKHPPLATHVPSAVELAGTLDSPSAEAVNAFEARWDLFDDREDFQLWEPDASPEAASIGIARPGTSSDAAVRISLRADNRVRMSALDTGSPVDLAAASRVLHLPAHVLKDVLVVVADALHHMRTVAGLAQELRNAQDHASSAGRTLDREAQAAGYDAGWLKNPQAQLADVAKWEAARDLFTAVHGAAGVTASGLDDPVGMAMDVSTLMLEQEALREARVAVWRSVDPARPRRSRQAVHALSVPRRVIKNVPAYIRHTRNLGKALRIAQERQRIANGLEGASERLYSAEVLVSAHTDVIRLRQAVIGAVRKAATPDPTPRRPMPYVSRTGPGTSRTHQPGPIPTEPPGPVPLPGAAPPGL